jgi:hypothetical protein
MIRPVKDFSTTEQSEDQISLSKPGQRNNPQFKQEAHGPHRSPESMTYRAILPSKCLQK